MNKFKLHIVTLGVIGLIMTSCFDNFLDTDSKTESSTGNFYKTINDAKRALYGCYDGWQCTTSNGSVAFYVTSQIMADECFGATGNTDGLAYQVIDRFDMSQSPADMNIFEGTWKDYYAAIYRCNELIAHEEQIDWKENNKIRGTYMGECRVLRALLYFDMVRLWGNIPLLTEPVNENKAQADPDEVYAAIVEDLKYAVENIPADAYPRAEAADNDGHITKYAAEALLARVYLYYTGYYGKELAGVTKAEVLAGLEDVISSNEYQLVSEFKNLWPAASSVSKDVPADEAAKENYVYGWDPEKTTYVSFDGGVNNEAVLTQKFNYTQDYNGNSDGNRWLVMMGVRGISSSPYGKGWGACTVHPKMWSAYGSGDTRRTASIINLEGEGVAAAKDFEKKHKKDQREYTGYTVKKYTTMAYADGTDAVEGLGDGDFQISQYQDFLVVRFSDVLLMAAELGSANAKTYLNTVRKRAYTTDSEGSISGEFKEVEPTKENIMKERMLEFAFEGQRYWDLLRQGVEYAAGQIAESGVQVLNGNNPATVSIDAQNIITKKGLMQIPSNQIRLSGNVLKQNAGWGN